MTEPDLVIVSEKEVVFIECKLNANGNQSPWKAQSKGSEKRFSTYINDSGFRELSKINNWKPIYQLVRQYVYAKSMAHILGLKPLVIPLINREYKERWQRFYQPLLEFNPNVFRPFKTWQEIRDIVSGSNIEGHDNIIIKIDNAVNNN